MATAPHGPHLCLLVVLSLALAGCVGDDDADAPQDDESEAPAVRDIHVILSYNMTATCTITELSLPGAAEEARAFLPNGFRLADHETPYVVVVQTCDGATGAAVELFVRVEPPHVDPRVDTHVAAQKEGMQPAVPCDAPDDHRYYIAGYSDTRFWVERYRQAGIPTVAARVSQSWDALPDTGLVKAALLEARASMDGGDAFSFDAGVAEGGVSSTCHTAWFQSDHGLLLVHESRGQEAAYEGRARCEVAEGQPFAWALDPLACAQASATMVPTATRAGYAFWFHETFVTPESGA